MMFENEDDRRWHLGCIAKIFEDCGNFSPALFTEMDGKRICVPLEMKDDKAKNEVSKTIKMGIISGRMKELCFASESWVTTFDAGTDIKTADKSKGTRKEGIIVNFANAKEEHLYLAFITRDDDGNGTLGSWEKMPSNEATGGRFVNLFRSAAAMVN